ncbi:MAG: endo alpha-1,4 polygalactosaminidase [Marmoricola sp.]
MDRARTMRTLRALLVLGAALTVLLVALTASPSSGTAVAPLPTGTRADYQLGGARTVPTSVGIVVRDRHDRPAPRRYNVCYLNGFQTQPDESAFWHRHWSLVLKKDGKPVLDEAWGEWLLDTRTSSARASVASIVGRWINGCARAGFDAVELDNLDSFSRSHGLLTGAGNKALAKLLVARAHQAGLAAGQKNFSEWDGRSVGYDFAIAEECGRWHECGSYVDHFGSRVIDVEYRDADLRTACAGWAGRIAIVRRDLNLVPTGVRRWC